MTDPAIGWSEPHRRIEHEVGVILFTVLAFTRGGTRMERIYSSHPAEYPVGGWKDVATEVSPAWIAISRDSASTFLAATPAELETIFADHGLIASLGVGSILNVPLRRADGSNWGTVNLCGAEGTYTPERVALAERIIDELAPPEPVTTDSEGAPA
ncbi:GAF domain-containing protein [Agrococcus sp. UYP33]